MRYYSDELKRFFDTEEQCLAEEEKARIAVEEKRVTKAKLAKAIEDADDALDEAYEELKNANEKVAELQKEYDDKVDTIMTPAYDRVRECAKARLEAIKEFNDTFGVYTTTYSGNKALNEFTKISDSMNQFWKKFYY